MFIPLYDGNPLEHVVRPYVNYGLIAFTVVVFLLSGGLSADAVQQAAYSYGLIPAVVHDYNTLPPELIVIPDYLTYVSYAFLHVDLIHLGGNMLFLWVFGDNVEDALGHIRYLIFYVLCILAGGFAHALVDPDSVAPLIGASGAVAGVVGAYLMLHPKVRVWILVLGRIPLRLSAGIVLGFWALFQIYSAAVAAPDEAIAWWAHIGGFLAGAVLVTFMKRRGVVLFDRDMPPPRKV